jgi:UDP-glucose 4-epimerase
MITGMPDVSKKIIVTGGLGYIGTHLVDSLIENGYRVLVIDKVMVSKYGKVPKEVRFVRLNLADEKAALEMLQIFKELPKNTQVVHLAAEKSVEESMSDPEFYERENVTGTRNLLWAMTQCDLKKITFASSAAVYGSPKNNLSLSETSETNPLSPYARTKLACEDMIVKLSSKEFDFAILRFFNVAGASRNEFVERDGKNLIPKLLASRNEVGDFQLFGNDYPTPDGTCVRDFVDVRDLVSAILKCINTLENQSVGILNIGSGCGYSVKQIIEALEKVIGKIKYVVVRRREGDPASVIADIKLAREVLDWNPVQGLEDMVSSMVEKGEHR